MELQTFDGRVQDRVPGLVRVELSATPMHERDSQRVGTPMLLDPPPSLDVVRALDARTNIGYAVEAGAASDTEPEVHEDGSTV